MKLFPLMMNLEGRPVTVIGGGGVASRKAASLLEAGARVTVISPEISEKIRGLRKEHPGRLEIVEREYRTGDLAAAVLVFTASGDPGVTRQAVADAAASNILINAADSPECSSFHVPSFIRKGDLVLALATGGASPAMAARLRRDLENHLPYNIEEILAVLQRIRDILKEGAEFSALTADERGGILKKIVNDDFTLGRLRDCGENEKKIRSIISEFL